MTEPAAVASESELTAALFSTGYTYTDPVNDETFPYIVEPGTLDEFPPGWGEQPTERDQAVIDASDDAEVSVKAIDLNDYAHTAKQRGWGAGWPSCAGAAHNIATIVGHNPDGSVAAKVTVRKRLARLVNLLLDECERRGYNLWADQCGGYNCRPIANTRVASNHSWAVAVDLNWRQNPMRRPLVTNIPGWMVQLWNRYGFAWGGHYRSTPDPMHFEFMGTPSDADGMTALAIEEIAGGHPTLRRGSTGDAVRRLQAALHIPVDGLFGPQTEAAVRKFQKEHNLDVDGIVGPRTWAALKKSNML